MHIEIERKFLVKSDAWRGKAQGLPIRQGYLARQPGRSVRVRLTGEKAWLTVKCGESSLRRTEFEYEIPVEDAGLLLDGLQAGELIEKTRYTFEEMGALWEVDEFHGANAGLIVAEIELKSEEQAFARPAWLGEEVTHDSRYTNAALARNPWPFDHAVLP